MGGHPTESDLARVCDAAVRRLSSSLPDSTSPAAPSRPLAGKPPPFGICRMPASTSSPGSVPVGAPFTWAAPAPWAHPTPPQIPLGRLCSRPRPLGGEDVFSATAARMSAFNAFSSILSPSWKSMARLVLPSRLELKRPEGSSNEAPLAKVIFTTNYLYVSRMRIIPACDRAGTPLHFHSSTTSGSACLMRIRTRASVSPRQSLSSLILASISREESLLLFLPSSRSSSCSWLLSLSSWFFVARLSLEYR